MRLAQCVVITYNENRRARYVRLLVAVTDGLPTPHDRIAHIQKVLGYHNYDTAHALIIVEADESFPALTRLAKDVITIPLNETDALVPFERLEIDQCYGFGV